MNLHWHPIRAGRVGSNSEAFFPIVTRQPANLPVQNAVQKARIQNGQKLESREVYLPLDWGTERGVAACSVCSQSGVCCQADGVHAEVLELLQHCWHEQWSWQLLHKLLALAVVAGIFCTGILLFILN